MAGVHSGPTKYQHKALTPREIYTGNFAIQLMYWLNFGGRTHGLLFTGIRGAVQIFDVVTGSEKYMFNPGNVWFNPCHARVLQSIYTHTHTHAEGFTFCLHCHDVEVVGNYV
jgi:hypothetical protein